MPKIIGQTKLMSIIDSYTLQSLPKTLMLVGPSGCGKHTVAKYLTEKFEFDYVEIDENIIAAELESFLYKTINTLYLIDLNKFSEKQQNQFLKFIEEPSKSVYVLLITNSEVAVLDTVLNRCTKHYFEPYTVEQVSQITNSAINDLAFKIFRTPGKLLNLTENSFKDILALAEKVVKKINIAPYANAISISTKINYKDLYNKIDYNLFFDVVEYLAFEDFKNNNSLQSLTVFNVTNKFKQHATQTNLIKEMLMLNYLTTLWEAVQV